MLAIDSSKSKKIKLFKVAIKKTLTYQYNEIQAKLIFEVQV